MGRGRKRIPDGERPVAVSVRLMPKVADAVYRLAKARDVSQYQFLGDVISRVITLHEIRHGGAACYRDGQQSSTLSYTLSEPPS